MTFHAPIPILRIFDEAKARELYLDYLGFTVRFEHRFEPGAPLTAKHYKYYRPGLQDQEWGTREMTVADGFGNKLIFFRPLS